MLPLILVVGFVLVLFVLFADKLLPAPMVQVEPVVTLRSETPQSKDTIEVSSEVAKAEPQWDTGDLLFQASGWIEPDPFPIVVPTLVSGIIDKVNVLEGESVKAGQQLANLIDDDAKFDLQAVTAKIATLESEIEANQARIPLANARRKGSSSSIDSEKANLAELKDRLQRLESLPRGSISEIDLTSARLKVKEQSYTVDRIGSSIPEIDSELVMIEKQIEAKRNALREAQVDLSRCQLAFERHTIRSPVDGVIMTLHVAPGHKRMVHMDNPKSAYIVELFDPEKLQARIDVPLSEAAAISVGQPVEMVCDLIPDISFKGKVTRINGEADIQRNTLQVKVAITDPDSRMRPEMLVRGKFYSIPRRIDPSEKLTSSDARRLSIYVPERAIVSENKVWVVGSGDLAERRTLSLGDDVRDNHRLALGGVRSGELVILPPHNKLKNGGRIKIAP